MIAALLPILWFDLQGSDGGFVPAGSTGQWAWVALAPGQSAWVTGAGGAYFNDAADTLEVPLPERSELADPMVVFDHWNDIRPGDRGLLQVNDGSGWVEVPSAYGDVPSDGLFGVSGGWRQDGVRLAGYPDDARFRFRFESDGSGAARGWAIRSVALYDGDGLPPRTRLSRAPGATQDTAGPYVIEVAARDDRALTEVFATVAVDGGAAAAIPMTPVGGDLYRAEIDGLPLNSFVTWQVVARDGSNETVWPPESSASFRVYGAAPERLRGPDGRPVGSTLALRWDPPVSPMIPVGYVVESGETPPRTFEVSGTEVVVPVPAPGQQRWRVAARYDGGLGDFSGWLSVDVDVPRLLLVDPGQVLPGDVMHVVVEGRALYLHEDALSLDLGDGIGVSELRIVDGNRLSATANVAPNAAPGPRAVVVGTPYGDATLEAGLVVGEESERPQIAVYPDVLHQGETAVLRLVADTPFQTAPTIDAGDGVILKGDPQWIAGEAAVEVVVLRRAATGTRLLLVDDGERLWSATLTIRPEREDLTRQCGHAPSGAGWLVLPAFFLVSRRRRR